MIHASQIALFQSNNRQVSAMDASPLSARPQASLDTHAYQTSRTDVSISREAINRYNSQESLPISHPSSQRADERLDTIRKALVKLNDIRKQQEEFIARSKAQGKAPSPLDDYLDLIDRLRLELLNSQDQKKQAASRYLDFARREFRTWS